MIYLFCLLFSFSLLASDIPDSSGADFDALMGKEKEFVQTTEDRFHLSFFKALYDMRSTTLLVHPSIPKVIHMIWLGSEEFPENSKKNVAAWIEKHPEWKVKFWTDQERLLPHPHMQKQLLENFTFTMLQECYDASENYGEKAEVLCYEILYQEGGIYVDHDTFPVRSFDSLHACHDFYAGLEMLGATVLSSSVYPSIHLVAAKPSHPILRSAMMWLKAKWNFLETSYPGADSLSTLSRVKHRSFSALSVGIRQSACLQGNQDVIFPSFYFSSPSKEHALFASHAHEGTWYAQESPFEKKMKQELEELKIQSEHLFLWTLSLILAQIAGVLLFWVVRKKRILLLLFLFPLLVHSDEFEEYMGKETSHWAYVKQPQDIAALERFQSLYSARKHLQFATQLPLKIPEVVHFIWLGPRPFPPQSVENVRSWMAKHPEWTFKFWTDRERSPPCIGMQTILVQDIHMPRLAACFNASENYGEKSDILRYEILFNEGGVYADHDASCLQSFEGLHHGYDFYCGLEAPHPPFVGLNITCGCGLIGARPHHPVVNKVIDLIATRWNSIGKTFRGRDGFSRTQLVMQRTYIALTHALEETLDKDGNSDIVFPAAYFFAKTGIPSLYSKHFYANSWAEEKEKNISFEKDAYKKVRQIKQRHENMRLVILIALSVNIILSLGAFYFRRRQKL